MARLVALADRTSPYSRIELPRAVVVTGCALALILARTGLPF